MSIPEKLDALRQALGFGTLLRQKLEEVPAEVNEVFNVGRLESLDANGLASAGGGLLLEHLADTDNPHQLTTDDLDVYESAYIDEVLEGLLDGGMMPVSRYGTMDYLPQNTEGVDDGVVEVGRNLPVPMAIERDGSLTYLRYATNGERRDLYYSFVKDYTAISGYNIPQPVNTGRRYRPYGFPENMQIVDMYCGYEGAIAGRYYDVDLDIEKDFIVATNGTLDASQHLVFEMDAGSLEFGDFTRASFYRHTHPELGDRLFCLETSPLPSIETPFTYRLWFSPIISTLNQGDLITWVPVSNDWDVTTMDGSVLNDQSKFTFTDYRFSLIDTDKAMISRFNFNNSTVVIEELCDATPNAVPFIHPTDGRVRFYVGGRCKGYRPNTVLLDEGFAWTFVVNPTTKTAMLDEQTFPYLFDDADPAGVNFSFSPDNYLAGDFHTKGLYFGYACFSDTIVLATMEVPTLYFTLRKRSFTSYDVPFQNAFENVKVVENGDVGISLGSTNVRVHPKKAGKISSNITGLTLLDSGYAIAITNGWNDSNNFEQVNQSRLTFVRNDILDLSYVHHSGEDRQQTYFGVAPLLPQKRITDTSISFSNLPLLFKLVQITRLNGYIGAHGGWFVKDRYNTVAAQITPSTHANPLLKIPAISTGRIQCSNAVMQPVMDSILAIEGLTPTSSSMEFCYLDSSVVGVPIHCFVLVNALDTVSETVSSVLYAATVTTSLSGSTLQITGISLGVRIGGEISTPADVYTRPNRNATLSEATQASYVETGPIIVHEFDNHFMIMGKSAYRYGTAVPLGWTGGVRGIRFRFLYSKETDQFSNCVIEHTDKDRVEQYWACPGHGVGVLIDDPDVTDAGRKTLFKPIAKDFYEVDFESGTGWNPNRYGRSDWIVPLSSKNPSGFALVFPQQEPVMILGKVFTLPITTIQLSSVDPDPTNKTFYVFVELSGEDAVYVVETTPRADTADSIYIGYVKTDDLAIVEVNLEKITKIAEYRLSVKPCGLGIAVTSGSVNNAGSLDPDWIP